jgi:hypothetical protein
MTEVIYLLTLILPLGTILIVFAMRYVSAVLQARACMANDQSYRLVADRAAAAGTETAAALSSIQSALAEITTRISSVEKILKDVE